MRNDVPLLAPTENARIVMHIFISSCSLSSGRTQTWGFSDADEAEDIAGRRAACGPPHSAFIRVVKREIYGISRNSSETQLAFSSGNYSVNVAKVETMDE